MTQHLFMQRSSLSNKAVIIECLNNDGELIKDANASGFILREKDGLYLYTCWHVVTGLNMHELPVKENKLERMTLRVSHQKSETN